MSRSSIRDARRTDIQAIRRHRCRASGYGVIRARFTAGAARTPEHWRIGRRVRPFLFGGTAPAPSRPSLRSGAQRCRSPAVRNKPGGNGAGVRKGSGAEFVGIDGGFRLKGPRRPSDALVPQAQRSEFSCGGSHARRSCRLRLVHRPTCRRGRWDAPGVTGSCPLRVRSTAGSGGQPSFSGGSTRTACTSSWTARSRA